MKKGSQKETKTSLYIKTRNKEEAVTELKKRINILLEEFEKKSKKLLQKIVELEMKNLINK